MCGWADMGGEHTCADTNMQSLLFLSFVFVSGLLLLFEHIMLSDSLLVSTSHDEKEQTQGARFRISNPVHSKLLRNS